MEISQYRFNREEKRLERVKNAEKTESMEKVESETKKSVETSPEKISTAETVVGAVLFGMKVKHFLDNKGPEIKGVVEEAKKDIQIQPTEIKPIIGNSILRLGSLLLDHAREQKEQKLEIRQKFINLMREVVAKGNQLEMLNDYERLQQETAAETLKSPVKITGLSEEEKTRLREKARTADEIRNKEARKKFEEFINNLPNKGKIISFLTKHIV